MLCLAVSLCLLPVCSLCRPTSNSSLPSFTVFKIVPSPPVPSSVSVVPFLAQDSSGELQQKTILMGELRAAAAAAEATQTSGACEPAVDKIDKNVIVLHI